MRNQPITAVIVGAGHRAFVYSKLALTDPDKLKIVGVADPDKIRQKKAMEMFGFPKENCFDSALELSRVPKFADAVINGTMDEQHVETSIPLLKKGYDMLLEKPFATNEKEMRELVSCVKENGNKVMICHVLRYNTIQEKQETKKQYSRKQILYYQFLKLVREYSTREHQVAFYADKLCITSRYLNEIISLYVNGRTPKQLIDEQLTAEIKVLLDDPHLSVTEIAQHFNFPDQSYLSRFFKKNTGLSPKEFRNQKR